jgi:hypothetical protein
MTTQLLTGSELLRCERFGGTLDDWGEAISRFPDLELFQTPAWIRFLAESQRASPVLLVLKDGAKTVGYFAGLIVRKAGLRILGSPFIGWTTERMGIRLLPGVSKRAAVEAVMRYAFKELKCVHFELFDLNISRDDVAGLGFQHGIYRTSIVDLTPDEDAIYSAMSSKSCRYCIRKAEKLGVVIEEAYDEGFADDYYAQLCDVFAKQSLIPTYGKRRVQLLIRHLLPTGNLLLLRAREPQGRCIATGIFLGMNQYAYFWGNASWRQDQHLCPNEAIHWHAMRYWKRKGVHFYDFCGGGLYKRKYGGRQIESYHLWKNKYPWIGWARSLAERGYHFYRRIAALQYVKHRDEPSKGDA